MGGYVGLLLGFSILQIPELMFRIFDNLKGLYKDRPGVQNHAENGPCINSTNEGSARNIAEYRFSETPRV